VKVEDIEIHSGDLDRPYTTVGQIQARVTSATAFSQTRTADDVNGKLREEAMRRGANAVINVQYRRGASLTSWKALTATGTAVLATDMYRECPHCKEQMRRDASTCPHCRTPSDAWRLHDGYWWVERASGQYYLDPRTNEWLRFDGKPPPSA
jgi:hypothetical protein